MTTTEFATTHDGEGGCIITVPTDDHENLVIGRTERLRSTPDPLFRAEDRFGRWLGNFTEFDYAVWAILDRG